jgi:exodeoxyribonuclease (lambda-induced)
MKTLMSSDNLRLIDELITEHELGYYDVDEYTSPEMEWGIDHESQAIELYEQTTGNQVTRVGMLQSERYELLTVSPDGLVGDVGAVEVKCPKTKTHVRYIRMGVIPAEYKPQVLQYFLVHDKLQWLDFISFDPRLERKPIFIKRITRAELQLEIDDAWARVERFVTKFNKYKEEIWF